MLRSQGARCHKVMAQAAITVMSILVMTLQGGISHAKTCGKYELAKLREFSNYVIDERNKVHKQIEKMKKPTSQRQSLSEIARNLHSLYLIACHMEDLIKIYCMDMECKQINLSMMTKMFEQANMNFYGIGGVFFKMSLTLDNEKEYPLVELCKEIEQKTNAISTVSLEFYGALYEMRGEPTPPSP